MDSLRCGFWRWLRIGFLLHVALSTPARSAPAPCERALARLVSVQGEVDLRDPGSGAYRRGQLDELLCPGAAVRIGPLSRAGIAFLETDEVFRLDADTTLELRAPAARRGSIVHLARGVIHFFSRVSRSLEVWTPFVNAAVEGTEFVVRVEADLAVVIVLEGSVALANDWGRLALGPNESAEARSGASPELRVIVRPRDAVQWALYYDPVIPLETSEQPGRRPPESVFLQRAERLLAAGRVEEARTSIEAALESSRENASAYALLAVIAVALNDKSQALAQGREAVRLEPSSAAARIALSYALQANFELEAARDSLRQAVTLEPGNGLAWARLAEVQFMLGGEAQAIEAAATAASLSPELGRTNIVLGFAALRETDLDGARSAFEKAIRLDSASPLARLGLGLARIRGGDLAGGRREIEIAASLDPGDPLVRSYLGKAYYEEKQDDAAGSQYDSAKELDPLDPTPWFYDAIRKQTLNHPVEAFRDLQTSIALNDRRAVYRSRLMLDEDLAARSSSLARIYSDLGFQELALLEGWKSLEAEPADYSAHRFLADSYAELPRHEIARVSELLQSQLLQPINLTPLQPQLAETNLFIVAGSGPASFSFHEFNPLFTRDRLALELDGVLGQTDTLADDVVFSGIEGRLAFSAGQYHFETDGYRENNDLAQDLYNVFLQARLRPQTSLQTEFRASDIDQGDRYLFFDRETFADNLRQTQDVQSVRFGVRHQLSPGSDLISNVTLHWARFDTSFVPDLDINQENDGYIAEVQHLLRRGRFRLIAGGGRAGVGEKSVLDAVFLPEAIVSEADRGHTNLYLYSHLGVRNEFSATLGTSLDSFEGIVDRLQLNPKLGLTWTPAANTTVRGAAFRGLQRTLITNQTIEPTQVAGFNQFFEDGEGTDAWRYGAAIDQKISPSLFGGIEISRRDLQVPAVLPFSDFEVTQDDAKETWARAYLSWAPRARWAVGATYTRESLSKDLAVVALGDPRELETQRLELNAAFFHPSGWKASLNAGFLDQEGEFGDAFGEFVKGEDRFWVLDGELAYRLPGRLGILTLVGKNLLNEDFRFQDIDPTRVRLSPRRLVLVRASLFF